MGRRSVGESGRLSWSVRKRGGSVVRSVESVAGGEPLCWVLWLDLRNELILFA